MAKPRANYARKATLRDADKLAIGATFTFNNEAKSVLSVKFTDYPTAIRAEAESHGIRQKIGDSWNKATSADEAFQTATGTHNRLVGGDWNGEKAFAPIDERFIILAIMEQKPGPDFDARKATWDNLSDEAKAEIRADDLTNETAKSIRAKERAEAAKKQASDSETASTALSAF